MLTMMLFLLTADAQDVENPADPADEVEDSTDETPEKEKKSSSSLYGGIGVPKFGGGFGFRGHVGFASVGRHVRGGLELNQNSFGSADDSFNRSRFRADLGWAGAKGNVVPVVLFDMDYNSFSAFGGSSFDARSVSDVSLRGGISATAGPWNIDWMAGVGRVFTMNVSTTDMSAGQSVRFSTTFDAERSVIGGFGTLKAGAQLGTYRTTSFFGGTDAAGVEAGALVNLLALGLSEKLTPGAFASLDLYSEPMSVAATGGVSFRGGF